MNSSNQKRLKVLYINGGTMDMGGISSYMMNYFRCFDENIIHIDFIVHGQGGKYDKEIINNGCSVFHVPTKRENYIDNIRQIKSIMKSGNYNIVHAHADGMNGKLLKMAKECGVLVRISHSHNTEHLTTNKIKILYHEYMRKQIPQYATHLWSCSKKAGEWLYGDHEFEVIPNAIDTNKFSFNVEKREELRRQLGIENNFVIGHIGRFDIQQKNQLFLLEVFSKMQELKSDVKLILIGEGKDRQLIEEKIRNLKLSDNTILLGQQDNVNEWLNVFDLFCLPSHFEGFPVVGIEAQANGLHCVCSDTITDEINLTGNIQFLPLNDIDAWKDALSLHKNRERTAIKTIVESGYDIKSASHRLQERYIRMRSV